MKLTLSVLLLVLLASLALAKTDPELKQCRHQCKVQRQYGREEVESCLDRCDDYYREKQQRERRGRGSEEEEWGGRGASVDPEKRLRQCQTECDRQQQQGQQRALCHLRCQQTYERERGRQEEEERRRGRGRQDDDEEYYGRREEQGEEEEEFEGGNPYVFEDQHFTSRFRSQHGRIDVLQKFTDKSKLLRGLEDYRVAILEANPQTFIAPSHWDADGVLFVAQGKGTITMVHEEKRESFNIEQGNVIRVRAGTPVYLINRDENEKLYIIKFLRPVNLPGQYEAFLSAGSESQQGSFYKAFSWELLEAALKTDRRKLEQIFRQNQGVIVKASKEQIRSMSHREEGKGIWPFGESSSSFNLLKSPEVSNNHGKLFEAKPEDHKQQLHDLDLAVSLANITRGSMMGPFYNSKATKISIVLDGEGYFEMACPHVDSGRSSRSSRRSSKQGPSYHKVTSQLKPGTVFIVPAGHPVATVASGNKNLAILCFEVNAWDNTKYPLAGKNNVVKRIEKDAKELAFGAKAREVEQVFGNEDEEFFFPGPKGGRQRQPDLIATE